jgi:hypothetical protein
MKTSPTAIARHPAFNFVAAQLGWLFCVVSAAKLRPALGVAFALAVIGMHLYSARAPRTEAALLMFAAVLGTIFDSMLLGTGWLSYPSGMIVDGVAPYWIIVMWPLFATMLNSSMAWLKGRLLLAALMGAVFGPLAYRAGAALGAVQFLQPTEAYSMLAIGWAIAMPVLLAVASHLDGMVALPVADTQAASGVGGRV